MKNKKEGNVFYTCKCGEKFDSDRALSIHKGKMHAYGDVINTINKLKKDTILNRIFLYILENPRVSNYDILTWFMDEGEKGNISSYIHLLSERGLIEVKKGVSKTDRKININYVDMNKLLGMFIEYMFPHYGKSDSKIMKLDDIEDAGLITFLGQALNVQPTLDSDKALPMSEKISKRFTDLGLKAVELIKHETNAPLMLIPVPYGMYFLGAYVSTKEGMKENPTTRKIRDIVIKEFEDRIRIINEKYSDPLVKNKIIEDRMKKMIKEEGYLELVKTLNDFFSENIDLLKKHEKLIKDGKLLEAFNESKNLEENCTPAALMEVIANFHKSRIKRNKKS